MDELVKLEGYKLFICILINSSILLTCPGVDYIVPCAARGRSRTGDDGDDDDDDDDDDHKKEIINNKL